MISSYIGVDIYGRTSCSGQRCPLEESGKCLDMVNTTYKVRRNDVQLDYE